MTKTAYDSCEQIGTTDFDVRELDTLRPEDWLRLIDDADPTAGYEMFKLSDGTFQIVDTANVDVDDNDCAGFAISEADRMKLIRAREARMRSKTEEGTAAVRSLVNRYGCHGMTEKLATILVDEPGDRIA
jgi:hypothetical protein